MQNEEDSFKIIILSSDDAMSDRLDQKEVLGIGRALQLAGGVVAIVLGGVDLLTLAVGRGAVGLDAIRPVFAIVVGLIALVTLSEGKSEGIQLVLIVLGLIGGNAGGILIALAGIVNLVGHYAFGGSPTSSQTPPSPPMST